MGRRRGQDPRTLTFATPGGGKHYLFAWPGDTDVKIRSLKDGNKEKLKVLAGGSQTVMPPSIHPNGGRYAWLPGCGPGDLPLAACPDWLLKQLLELSEPAALRRARMPVPPLPPTATPMVLHRARRYLDTMEVL